MRATSPLARADCTWHTSVIKFTRPARPSATAGSLGPRRSSSSASRIWQRAASNQQSASASGAGTLAGDAAHLRNPRLELREEERVGHGDRKLAALYRFRPLVGRLQLRIHPLIAEEARAVFGDAVATHQADRFAHHLCAPARVP